MTPPDLAERGTPPPDPETAPAAERWAVFLDVDGTLLVLQARPEQTFVPAPLRDCLDRLSAGLGGAVALISGRSLADLDRLFRPLHLPSAGLHGLERRRGNGEAVEYEETAALDHLRPELSRIARDQPGVLMEDKGRAVALHYRGVPEHGPSLVERVRRLARNEGDALSVIDGKMVVEVKPRHADKGSAILAFLDEPPFAGRTPVFLGDDTTDEDGFRAVNRIGGVSVRVGAAGRDGTAATYRLPDEPAVEAWLNRLAARVDGDTANAGAERSR